MATTVTKDMTIGELLALDNGCAVVLMEAGMHCVGCPASAGESIEEAAAVHGFDVNILMDKLNAYFQNK
jgi:hybrid cluster-associated redox disulfide protein